DLQLEFQPGGARVTALVAPTAPAYAAGLEEGDTIRQVDGESLTSGDRLQAVMRRHQPRDRVTVVYESRSARGAAELPGPASTIPGAPAPRIIPGAPAARIMTGSRTAHLMLGEDPHVEVVPLESSGPRLTSAQQAFRAAWL